MRVDEFDFDLPRELIAEHPIEPRDASRLLVIGTDLDDRHIGDLPHLLRAGDVLVANDTRVIPAQLTGTRGAATIDVTLHRDLGGGVWRAFVKGARRLKQGDTVGFGAGFAAKVVEKTAEGDVVFHFDNEGAALKAQLERFGRMPLPPYIHRGRAGEARDRHDYQTMFAARDGAVAAPTAGLHFTPALLAALNSAGIGLETVTLHVGAGTFLPVKVEDTDDHDMHAECGIDRRRRPRRGSTRRAPRGGRVVAIGTTSLRLLESAAADERADCSPLPARPRSSSRPAIASAPSIVLLTNFHLPRSTLFMLVVGLCRARAHESRLCPCRRRALSLLFLWRCCLLYPRTAS